MLSIVFDCHARRAGYIDNMIPRLQHQYQDDTEDYINVCSI